MGFQPITVTIPETKGISRQYIQTGNASPCLSRTRALCLTFFTELARWRSSNGADNGEFTAKKGSMDGYMRSDQLERCWLQQLYHEYEDVCLRYGVELPAPIFEISDSRKVYGSWHAATGILSISRHLILHHSWSVVLQVLKHEMAHQLCGQVSPVPERLYHGETFQRACEQLGVLPEFRRPGLVVPEMLEAARATSELSENGRKCLARISKLLALGRSANEHEAALAMEKANELLEKYHLQGIGAGQEQRYGCVVIDRKKKNIAGYQRHICSILQEYFFVRVVLSQLYDPTCGASFKVIELFGTRENVAIAEYCYHFLENHLALLWSTNRSRFQGVTRTEKNSYFLGLLRGFRQKLSEQKKGRATQTCWAQTGALIVAEEQRLAWFVGLCYPRLRRVSAKGAKVYGTTYNQGVAEGRQIILNEGLAGEVPIFGGLLGSGA